MTQQYPQYPPRTFSPLQRTESSHTGPYPPPPKRQRLSPDPHSPYASPSMSNISLPNQVFSSPYYGGQPNGGQNNNYNMVNPYNSNNTYNTINTPYPPTPTGPPAAGLSGTMGPPSRPIDKPTDINELDDVLMGSGVNLKDEDEALTNQGQRHNQSHNQEASKPYPFPRNNFYSQYYPGDQNSFYGGGTFNQPTAPYQSAEEITKSNRKRAARRRYEIQQYELTSPFLMAAPLKRRINTEVNRMQVKFDDSGLFVPQQNLPSHKLAIQGPDGHDIIRVVQNEDILRCNSTLAEILSLISLATEERLRAVIEDTATLAKGRKIGSHGIIPHNLADLALGNGSSKIAAALPTPDNSIISPTSNPLKRSYAEVNKPLTPVSLDQPVVPNPVAQALLKIAKAERAQEEERLAKRQRRALGAGAGAANRSSLTPLGGSGPGTPLGEQAPSVEPKKVTLKKDKKVIDKATEAQQLSASNKTMNMALGGKKTPLWMMAKGADSGPSNPYLLNRPTVNTQKSSASKVDSVASILPKNRTYGEFREDKATGPSIELRDVIHILENSGKEKKALQRAYGRLGNLV